MCTYVGRQVMKMSLDERLRQYHSRFRQGHDMLRERLLADLGDNAAQPLPTLSSQRQTAYGAGWFRFSRRRAVIVAAAVLMLCVGVLFDGDGDQNAQEFLGTQAAYAAAIQRVANIESIHFRMSTPRLDGQSFAVEGWWRRPHDFRLVFDKGLVMTGNESVHCRLAQDTLTITQADGPSLEMAILGELGPFFPTEGRLAWDWVAQSKVLSSEKVQYKGEACLKIMVQIDKNDRPRRIEYIINERASAGKAPLIYDVSVYSAGEPAQLRERVEVLAIDRAMPESLFEIAPSEGVKVIDAR